MRRLYCFVQQHRIVQCGDKGKSTGMAVTAATKHFYWHIQIRVITLTNDDIIAA